MSPKVFYMSDAVSVSLNTNFGPAAEFPIAEKVESHQPSCCCQFCRLGCGHPLLPLQPKNSRQSEQLLLQCIHSYSISDCCNQ
jgi:hypothetical protein